MDTTVDRAGEVAIVRPASTIDGRAAIDFERAVTGQFDAGVRLFVIDFSGVTLITSAGIRVLLMLRKRTVAGGGLALCALSDRVKTLLDISGLTQHFHIADTRDAAVAYVWALQQAAPAAVPASPLGRVLSRLFGRTASPGEEAATGCSTFRARRPTPAASPA
jgi:stage II sporulation protein AA (anti-sigma F factor antagonist)